jgi:hypothetical protein
VTTGPSTTSLGTCAGLGRNARQGEARTSARGTKRLGERVLGRREGVLGKARGVGADAEANRTGARVDRRAPVTVSLTKG